MIIKYKSKAFNGLFIKKFKANIQRKAIVNKPLQL